MFLKNGCHFISGKISFSEKRESNSTSSYQEKPPPRFFVTNEIISNNFVDERQACQLNSRMAIILFIYDFFKERASLSFSF